MEESVRKGSSYVEKAVRGEPRRDEAKELEKTCTLGVPHTGPFLMLWLLVCIVQVGSTPSCGKCHYPLFTRETEGALLRIHTHPNSKRFVLNKLEVCGEGEKLHWLAENVGTIKDKLTGECPTKEKWICFE